MIRIRSFGSKPPRFHVMTARARFVKPLPTNCDTRPSAMACATPARIADCSAPPATVADAAPAGSTTRTWNSRSTVRAPVMLTRAAEGSPQSPRVGHGSVRRGAAGVPLLFGDLALFTALLLSYGDQLESVGACTYVATDQTDSVCNALLQLHATNGLLLLTQPTVTQ